MCVCEFCCGFLPFGSTTANTERYKPDVCRLGCCSFICVSLCCVPKMKKPACLPACLHVQVVVSVCSEILYSGGNSSHELDALHVVRGIILYYVVTLVHAVAVCGNATVEFVCSFCIRHATACCIYFEIFQFSFFFRERSLIKFKQL